MSSIRIKTVIETDGELHVANLPCRKGDEVEAIVILPDDNSQDSRQAARKRSLERARSSTFNSSAEYPSRNELHERDRRRSGR